jgi:acetyl-CoA C-acetyltransferase
VILGCASPSPDETNIGRMVALRLGCGTRCRLDGDAQLRQRHAGARFGDRQHPERAFQLVLAGGVDALSHAPLLYNEAMVRWFAG